jgi:putative DNA primase/helicase
MSAFESIRDRLGERVVKARGKQVEARCPAHEDRDPSLSLGIGNDGDRAVVHCHAGCATEDVMRELQLPEAALFDSWWDGEGKPQAVIVDAYDYTDADGQPLYQVVRTSPKDFFMRRPGANGAWVGKLDGVERVLYRLPEVIEAVKAGRRVFVVEGEKDAEALRRKGEVATCNPGGASKGKSKWRREYSEYLVGAEVIVVADADEPGRRHAEAIRASLAGVAASVRVVEPAEGKDAADHLAAGYGVDDFVAVRGDAQETSRSALIPFTAFTSKRVRWLWSDWIALGKITGLAGPPKIGKGLLHAHLVAQVTRGELEGDLHGEPRNVIVVTTEDDPGDTLKPRLQAARADMNRVFMLRMGTAAEPVPFRVPQDADELARHVRDSNAALVVVDPLLEFIDGKTDTHKSGPVRQAVSALNAIARESGCAILAVLHLNKGTSSDPLMRHEASAAFTQILRGAMMLGRDPDSDDESHRVLAATSTNLSRLAESLALRIVGTSVMGDTGEPIPIAGIEVIGTSHATGSDLLRERPGTNDGERTGTAVDEAEDFLRSELADGPRPGKEVQSAARGFGISVASLRRAKGNLGVKTGSDGFQGVWKWWLQSGSSTDEPLWDEPDGRLYETPVDTRNSAIADPKVAHVNGDEPPWGNPADSEGVDPLFSDEGQEPDPPPDDPPPLTLADEAVLKHGGAR